MIARTMNTESHRQRQIEREREKGGNEEVQRERERTERDGCGERIWENDSDE